MKNHIQICTGFLSYVHVVMDKGRDVGMGAGGGAVMLNSQAYVRGIFLRIVFSNLINTVESGHRSALNRTIL